MMLGARTGAWEPSVKTIPFIYRKSQSYTSYAELLLFAGDEVDELEFCFEPTALTQTYAQGVLGNVVSSQVWGTIGSKNNTLGFYNPSVSAGVSIALGTKYVVHSNREDSFYTINDKRIANGNDRFYSSSRFCVLGYKANPNSPDVRAQGRHKLYYVKGWRSGELIYSIVPMPPATEGGEPRMINQVDSTVYTVVANTDRRSGLYYEEEVV